MPNIPPPKGTKDSVLRKKLLKKYQAWKLAIHTNIEASSAATVQRSSSIVVCIGIQIYVNKAQVATSTIYCLILDDYGQFVGS